MKDRVEPGLGEPKLPRRGVSVFGIDDQIEPKIVPNEYFNRR